MLIVFEGIDGSGKNTQIKKVLEFLQQHRIKAKLHKYPTKKAKDGFAHLSGKKTVSPLRLANVFAKDIENDSKKICDEIKDGFVVICDRYLHSTLAYQGASAGYSKIKKELAKTKIPVPDLVILLDIDPLASVKRKRKQKKPDRFERNAEFLAKVRENYLRESNESFLSQKYAVIDASRQEAEVFSRVIVQIEPVLIKRLER